MTVQIYFEISIDLFESSNRWVPNASVRTFQTTSDHGKCTCEEIVQRQLQSGKWSEKFTQRILCLSSASLGTALTLLQENTNGDVVVLSPEAQKSILFNLKQLCECDRRPSTIQFSDVQNEWGLLDLELLKQDSGELSRCSSIAPVSMNFDQIVRPTPLVLHLAGFKTTNQLRQKVNREVERVITTKLNSKEHDDKPGYVYIMQRDMMPEYVKIGFSKKNAAIRHDSLRACFKDLRIVAHTNKVPHASKIERLAHAELMYFRRWQDCSQCGKQHQEWFEIDAKIAKRVVLRWARWLASEPYSRYGGKLKDEWREKIINKKTANVVVVIDRNLKQHLKQPVAEKSHPGNTEVELQVRQKIRSVSMVTIEKEVSYWYTPPGDARKSDEDDDSDSSEH